MSINVAFIGVGGYGHRYVEHFTRLVKEGKINLVAAAESCPEKCLDNITLLQSYGTKIVKSTNELYNLDVKFDLIGLPVGIESHEILTIEALEHNCNVLLEKPVAGCLSAVDNIIAARNKTNCFVAIGYQHFYEEATQKVKDFLCSKELGNIVKCKLMGRWPRGNSYYERNYWAGKIKGKHSFVLDSPFCNAFAHYVNMLLYLASDNRESVAVPVLTSATLSRSRDIENFDTGIVNITANNIPATIMLTHCCSVKDAFNPKLVITCEKGVVIYDESTTWQVIDNNGKVIDQFNYKGAVDHSNMFNAVIDRISNPNQRICTPELAKEHVRLIEEIYQNSNIKTLNSTEYTIEDGVCVNNNLAEEWNKLFEQL